jgi:hypothetical protein
MLSGVVELIPDRAWLTADAFIDVKGLTAASKSKTGGKDYEQGKGACDWIQCHRD